MAALKTQIKRIAPEVTTTLVAGRRRSEATRKLILQTTLNALKTQSLQSITIEGIARDAAVSKATIYRWWSSKGQIVIDAFIEMHLVKTPMRRDLPPAHAIVEHFVNLLAQYSGWSGHMVAQILAEAQSNPEIGREFRERFHYGRRAVVKEVLSSWKTSGELSADTDLEVLMDLIYAPIYMRLMVGHAPLDMQFAEAHLTYLFKMLGLQAPPLDAFVDSSPKIMG